MIRINNCVPRLRLDELGLGRDPLVSMKPPELVWPQILLFLLKVSPGVPWLAPRMRPEHAKATGNVDLVLADVLPAHAALVKLFQHGRLARESSRACYEQVRSLLGRWWSQFLVKPHRVFQAETPQLVKGCDTPTSASCAAVITGDGPDDRAIGKPDFVVGDLHHRRRQAGIFWHRSTAVWNTGIGPARYRWPRRDTR